jgi:formylglycine-generating enzyme
MVLIPSGTFLMGDQLGNGYGDERPVHEVTITRSFYMGIYEVTQKKWNEVMDYNPSLNKGELYPVERIGFSEMIRYCNKLSQQEGLTECYTLYGREYVCDFEANGYRLPTSAEWEYACRAGMKTDFYTGNGKQNRNRAGWFSSNSGGVSHPVGQKEPNEHGLYDMHGNVWETCWDWWDYDYYSYSQSIDPKGPEQSTGMHIQRGGSFIDPMPYGTCSDVLNNTPGILKNIGFRIVRTAD